MRFPRQDSRDPDDRARRMREYYRKTAETKKAKAAEWRRSNPRKRAAHQAVRDALLSGLLTRPDSCEDDECGKRPDAHHDNYDKPLEVLWLCRRHHRLRHQYLRSIGKDPD